MWGSTNAKVGRKMNLKWHEEILSSTLFAVADSNF